MASEEHKAAQTIIKECHKSLRQQSKLHGPEEAWQQHLKDDAKLQEYANAMHQLAVIWDNNNSKETTLARSRVLWVKEYCTEYFYASTPIYLTKRAREKRILHENPQLLSEAEQQSIQCRQLPVEPPDPICVLDVGSCFNPFAGTSHFDVTAIDLCPATSDVLRGDFLQLPIDVDTTTVAVDASRQEALSLPANGFHCVVFSLLLEYLPSAAQRLECCRKAYDLLRFEGLLLIITPDSQHVGKNAALMKNWRYTLGTIGFMRVLFQKFPHITCMAFRKAIAPCVAQHWAAQHREAHMSETIEIPQDSNNQTPHDLKEETKYSD